MLHLIFFEKFIQKRIDEIENECNIDITGKEQRGFKKTKAQQRSANSEAFIYWLKLNQLKCGCKQEKTNKIFANLSYVGKLSHKQYNTSTLIIDSKIESITRVKTVR